MRKGAIWGRRRKRKKEKEMMKRRWRERAKKRARAISEKAMKRSISAGLFSSFYSSLTSLIIECIALHAIKARPYSLQGHRLQSNKTRWMCASEASDGENERIVHNIVYTLSPKSQTFISSSSNWQADAVGTSSVKGKKKMAIVVLSFSFPFVLLYIYTVYI